MSSNSKSVSLRRTKRNIIAMFLLAYHLILCYEIKRGSPAINAIRCALASGAQGIGNTIWYNPEATAEQSELLPENSTKRILLEYWAY